MTTLRALARVVVAGVAVLAIRSRFWVRRMAGVPRWTTVEHERAAQALGYRGPLDPGGRWLEDLAAGRIDHDGNRRKP